MYFRYLSTWAILAGFAAALSCSTVARAQSPADTPPPRLIRLPEIESEAWAPGVAISGTSLVQDTDIAPTPPSNLQESPLDRAIRELNLGQQQPSSVPGESPLDQAVRGLTPESSRPLASIPIGGGAQLQLMDISMDALFAGGTSTQRDPSIQQLEGGDHDPHKRGFTFQNGELFLAGAVDPYFDAATNIVYVINPEGDTVVELEEAYATTRSLPNGLQVKTGQFFTEFGRNNPSHPHTWAWIDQPIINTRLFGPDGMRGPGARVSWLVPGDRYSEFFLGMQNANGETMSSFFASEAFFEERPVGGRPFVEQDVRNLADLVYWTRWQTSWTSCCEQATWLYGISGAVGPNATGTQGDTQIVGTDLTMKWKPTNNDKGWPFVIWDSEAMFRHYRAAAFSGFPPMDPTDFVDLSAETLKDWGLYTQVLWGFKLRWATGLRYEYVNGSGNSLNSDFQPESHDADPFRDERHRVSPLLAYYPTEFSRLRVQFNYDHAAHLSGKDAYSFWGGMEWLIGAHAAHKF